MTSVPHFVPALADITQHCHAKPWQPHTFSLYIHVPFCLQKCTYCDFYSVAGHGKLFARYVAAVCAQLRQAARDELHRQRRVASIFFGGGTPSILSPDQLIVLLQECEHAFDCRAEGLETSLEVNPATVDHRDFVQLRRAGFNRVSIGVQSLDDRELAEIGRLHTAAEAVRTVHQARRAGFANLSLDLMYGLPGQKLSSWQQTLARALDLAPDHLSLYELTPAQGTPLADQLEQGRLRLPDEDEVLAMLDHTLALTAQAGLQRYEISNYARSGYACIHNMNYWHNGSYLGFGPAAVSCMSGRRVRPVADVRQFCTGIESGGSIVVEEEQLDNEARFRESVIMGLRMINGVSLSALEERFSLNALEYYGSSLERLQQQKLLTISRDRLQLSEQGLLLANTVMAELV